ncbi:phosphate ABC transporter permease PstA [Methylocaldum sp. 14B]|uniref:phosphate ABC transporter permease PstA n=1 Tax=Methylocaldum sp. 14B TaxID=1912213 RepID=UPI001F0AE789|nr:phosphate ABC transporter permease PstA [Methylocaldum sp. 14B]
MFEAGRFAMVRGRVLEPLMTLAVWGSALLVAGAFLWLVGDLLWHGAERLSWAFLSSSPLNAGRTGGIGPILVSTLLILGVAVAAAVPLGLATAVLLTEFLRPRSRFGRLVGLSLDVLAGVPSIVFGLFGNAFFSVFLGLGFSILSGGLTLACMVLPILIRTAEASLRAVPDDWRLGSAALGLSRTAALRHILLPAASSGLVAGLLLGVGRAMAETAALIFTSGYVDRMPSSLFDSGRALSVHIYDLSMNVAGGDGNAYASALVLIGLLILINGTALYLAEHWLNRRIIAP